MTAPTTPTDPSPSPGPTSAPSSAPSSAPRASGSPPVPIHASVSVGRWIASAELSPGAGQVLAALWSGERDPFAPEGRVTVSRAMLAVWTGLALASLPRLLARLREVGAVERVHVTPHGTTYRLLRPEHGPTDHELNPFAPSPQTQVVAAAAELATKRVMARLADGEQRAPRERRKTPRVKPSEIALALEAMAGIEHVQAEDGTTRPSTRYSGDGAEHVAAAQRWISEHGMQAFAAACERARGMELPDLTTPKQRLMLFARPRALAVVLGQGSMPDAETRTRDGGSTPAPRVDARREAARARALALHPDATGAELDGLTEWFLQ